MVVLPTFYKVVGRVKLAQIKHIRTRPDKQQVLNTHMIVTI